MTSDAPRGTIVAALQPLHHLLHFIIPIGSEDGQAANDAVEHQGDREANPEARELHMLRKCEVDAQRDTEDIIGAGGEGCPVMNVPE